ncbi:hypothetical protein [Pedobacter antarcticus]|nr:hypothetical protein [Pedobacter antarcticus]
MNSDQLNNRQVGGYRRRDFLRNTSIALGGLTRKIKDIGYRIT